MPRSLGRPTKPPCELCRRAGPPGHTRRPGDGSPERAMRHLPVLAAVLAVPFVAVPPADAATPTCDGHRATIVGTPGDDLIIGTAHADVIVALTGSDHVDGRGGNDRICGGYGADRLRGGYG